MSMFQYALRTQSGSPPGASLQPVDDFDAYAVTPADGADLPSGQVPSSGGATRPTVALVVTGAGNVAVQLWNGGTATLTGLAAGQFLPIAVTRVLSTGTTATGILALY